MGINDFLVKAKIALIAFCVTLVCKDVTVKLVKFTRLMLVLLTYLCLLVCYERVATSVEVPLAITRGKGGIAMRLAISRAVLFPTTGIHCHIHYEGAFTKCTEGF